MGLIADNIAITAGAGTTIKTDDTASGHIQVMKLAVSADGGDTLPPVTADGQAVILRPETTGGLNSWSSTSDLDETEEEVKATAGQVYGYQFDNAAAAKRYIKWYANTAAGTIVGTTATLFKSPIPAGQSGHISFGQGIAFATGITVACTTLYADTDVTAPGTDDVKLTVFYK